MYYVIGEFELNVGRGLNRSRYSGTTTAYISSIIPDSKTNIEKISKIMEDMQNEKYNSINARVIITDWKLIKNS